MQKYQVLLQGEEEILISMEPIFRIRDVEKVSHHDKVWNVKLKMVYILKMNYEMN